MREPVLGGVMRYRLRVRTVDVHTPDLHMTGTGRIEVNPISVRRVVRPIVEGSPCSQLLRRAAFCRNRVDVELAVALSGKCEHLAIWRPAVPVGGRVRSDLLRLSSTHGHDVYARAARLG